MTRPERDAPLRRASGAAVQVAGGIAGAAVAVMMINIVADSALRSFFSRPIAGTFDRTQFWWMVTIAFGALGLAHRRNEHIEATVLFDLMPSPLKSAWTLFFSSVTSVLLIALTWFGWTAARANQARGEYSGGSGVAIWPARYWVPLGGALFLIQLALSLMSARAKARADSSNDRSQAR